MKKNDINYEGEEYDSFSEIESLKFDKTEDADFNEVFYNGSVNAESYKDDTDYEEDFFDEYNPDIRSMDEQIDEKEINEEKEEKLKFRKPNKSNTKNLKIILCIIGCVILAALLIFAGIKIFSVTSDERSLIYFSSNVLCEDGADVVAYEAITFELYNYADDLRISKEEIEDIDISVYCDSKDITLDCTVSTGEKTMQAGVKSSCTVTIALPDKYANKDIEVTASTKPIKKEIKAKFSYINTWGSTVEDASGNPCALLNLSANKDIKLIVEWDADWVVPESTNQYVKTAAENSNKFEVILKTGEGTQIAFFKIDPGKDYSNGNTAIKVSVSSDSEK